MAWLVLAPVGVSIGALGTGPASAETRFGGTLGLTASKFAVESNAANGAERGFRPSITFGGFVHLDIARPVAIQAEISGTNRGPKLIFEGAQIGNYSLDYLDLAILGRVETRIAPVVSLYALTGPTAHVLLRARFKNISGDTPVINDISDDTRRFDLGITGGGGVGIGPYSWGTWLIEARYTHGFIDVEKSNDDVAFRNRTISVIAGYQYTY